MSTMDYYLEFRNPLGNENPLVAIITNTVEILAPSRKQSNASIDNCHMETLIYMPLFQYEHFELNITVSDGTLNYDKEMQTISFRHKILLPGYKHWLMVKVVRNKWMCCT
eukprot:NODE_50_length_27150_cov_0.307308.p17 type:complete len:110 gc:universal NODE_50_length_27150_cov_0.307308:15665-15336(-)